MQQIPSSTASISPPKKLDGIAIGIRYPGSAQLAVQKIMGRREKRRALGH
jgi:hypothetical protein